MESHNDIHSQHQSYEESIASDDCGRAKASGGPVGDPYLDGTLLSTDIQVCRSSLSRLNKVTDSLFRYLSVNARVRSGLPRMETLIAGGTYLLPLIPSSPSHS
jgi:hypothetical protein